MVLEEFFPLFLEILKKKEQELHEAYLKPIDQGGVLEIISVWSFSISTILTHGLISYSCH